MSASTSIDAIFSSQPAGLSHSDSLSDLQPSLGLTQQPVTAAPSSASLADQKPSSTTGLATASTPPDDDDLAFLFNDNEPQGQCQSLSTNDSLSAMSSFGAATLATHNRLAINEHVHGSEALMFRGTCFIARSFCDIFHFRKHNYKPLRLLLFYS